MSKSKIQVWGLGVRCRIGRGVLRPTDKKLLRGAGARPTDRKLLSGSWFDVQGIETISIASQLNVLQRARYMAT